MSSTSRTRRGDLKRLVRDLEVGDDSEVRRQTSDWRCAAMDREIRARRNFARGGMPRYWVTLSTLREVLRRTLIARS